MASESMPLELFVDERNGNACGYDSENCRSAILLCSKDEALWKRFSVESKKLWRIAGPVISSRLAMFAMNFITQAFVGHMGNLEFSAISIAITVIVGFSFGFFVSINSILFWLK